MFGLYKSSLSSKNQLFYDSANNRMTTCRNISITGKCLAKDLIPRSGSTGGTYMTHLIHIIKKFQDHLWRLISRFFLAWILGLDSWVLDLGPRILYFGFKNFGF